MPKMIPPYCSDDLKSKAEGKIFNLLQASELDGTVLHSLGLSDHREKVFGEVDFVILCRHGVLCLEIKGGYVEREQGVWKFVNRHNRVTRKVEGPFQQVIGNMFSLRDHISKLLPRDHPIMKAQFACGVVFPDMTFSRKDVDVIPEIVFDNRNSDTDLPAYISRVFEYWTSRMQKRHGYQPGKLSTTMIGQLETLLRGDFSCVPSFSSIVDEVDKRLVALTQEQFETFRMVANNARVLVKGKAGTGKTLIALEHAKRSAVSGRRTAYLSFNRLISSFLRGQSREVPGLQDSEVLDITNFHELLSRYVAFSDAGHTPAFFTDVAPERFLECVSANKFPQYDAIFVDEGQDLLRVNYLLCIDAMLKGGLKDGNWYIFYDDNQNIYNPTMEDGLNLIADLRPAVVNLMVNCRNTKQISTYNKLLTGFEQGDIIKVEGESVTKTPYSDAVDLQKKVVNLIKAYLKQGINPNDIVILSPYTLKNSGLKGVEPFKSVCKFQDITGLKYSLIVNDSVKFCTVQSFKGMESKVVILIDVEEFMDANAKRVNYTGISRARALLHIFYSATAEEQINQVVQQSLAEII